MASGSFEDDEMTKRKTIEGAPAHFEKLKQRMRARDETKRLLIEALAAEKFGSTASLKAIAALEADRREGGHPELDVESGGLPIERDIEAKLISGDDPPAPTILLRATDFGEAIPVAIYHGHLVDLPSIGLSFDSENAYDTLNLKKAIWLAYSSSPTEQDVAAVSSGEAKRATIWIKGVVVTKIEMGWSQEVIEQLGK
jgi:hypothetical protein